MATMTLRERLDDFSHRARSTARVAVARSAPRIAGGVDRVTTKLDQRTGGRYHDKLTKVEHLTAKLERRAEADEGVGGAGDVRRGEGTAGGTGTAHGGASAATGPDQDR